MTYYEDFTPDHRTRRADILLHHIFHVIDKYIPSNKDHDLRRKCHRELHELLYVAGAEIVTDHDRAFAGLSMRGTKGWTLEEIRILEHKRFEAMIATISPIMPKADKP